MAIKDRMKYIPDWLFPFYYLRGTVNKRGLFNCYSCLAKDKGIDKLYFVLSFDCDTPEDIKMAWEVHSRTVDLGIMPVYAVPGKSLEKGEKVYKRIAETGAEFINHGYEEHAFYNETSGKYESCFFYDSLSPAQIRKDVIRGDKALRNTLGISTKGFRMPHFATFQRHSNIIFLHSVLKDLGYLFSTSTVPYYSFRYGPVFKNFGLNEFPLSGGWRKPLNVLDSWEYYANTLKRFNKIDYFREGISVAKNFKENHYCGILNYYADPSHIADDSYFFDTINEWSKIAQSTTYENMLREL